MESGLHFQKAKDVFEAFEDMEEDIEARPAEQTAIQFFAELSKSATPEEAVTFGSYLLPKRRAVWWGHECVRSVMHLLTDQDLMALQLAEAWVRDPDEEQRVAALRGGLSRKHKSPGVWIALAAAWTGGSLNLPELPPVPPPQYLTARAVNAGILSALARVDVKHRSETLRVFVEMGLSLATR